MIKQEVFEWQGRSLTRTYSDVGYNIQNVETKEIYGEAVDPTDANRVYEEIMPTQEEDEITDEEALKLLLGGELNEEQE